MPTTERPAWYTPQQSPNGLAIILDAAKVLERLEADGIALESIGRIKAELHAQALSIEVRIRDELLADRPDPDDDGPELAGGAPGSPAAEELKGKLTEDQDDQDLEERDEDGPH